MNKKLNGILCALFVASVCLAADDAGDPNGAPKEKEKKTPRQMISSSVSNKNEHPIPRIWFGLTGSYTPLKLMKAGANGYADPSTGNAFSATTSQGQVGGGAILNARLFSGYWLSLGAIYRFVGYDALENVNDTNGSLYTERERSRLIDFPVMLRYSGRKWNISKYTFYEIGATLREDISNKITTFATDPINGPITPAPRVTQTTFSRVSKGATAGIGVIGRDDFGIVVSPEVRYTYWLGSGITPYASGTGAALAGSQRNQVEVTVSFGF